MTRTGEAAGVGQERPPAGDVLRSLAETMVGLRVPLTARASAAVDGASVDDAGRLLVTVGLPSAGRWQLAIRLGQDDLSILREAGPSALDAYRQVVVANIGEWWHTGSRQVVVEAHSLS